jgi:hypothetical protein
MSAIFQDSTIAPLREAVRAAHATHAEAAAKLEAAEAARQRAREAFAECQPAADIAAAVEKQGWVMALAERVTSWIEGGSHGPRPVAAADAEQVRSQLEARANAAAAAAAVEHFEAAEARARNELAAAEAAIETAVDAMLDAKAIKSSATILRLVDEIFSLSPDLPNPLNTGLDKLRAQPLVLERALAVLEKLEPHDWNKPLGVGIGPYRADDTRYAHRRAALIRGDLDQDDEAAEPREEIAA